MLTTIEKLKSASGDLVKVILQNAKSFISFDEGIRSQISNMELVWSHLTVTGEREAVEDVKKSLHARHDVLTDEKLPSRRHPELAFNEIREQMDFDIDRNYRSQRLIWTTSSTSATSSSAGAASRSRWARGQGHGRPPFQVNSWWNGASPRSADRVFPSEA